jgi:L-rhamnose isomerase
MDLLNLHVTLMPQWASLYLNVVDTLARVILQIDKLKMRSCATQGRLREWGVSDAGPRAAPYRQR